MTVREFIKSLDPKKVLDGKYAFKVIKNSGVGDKWFFWNDKNDNPANSVEEFCNHDGIVGCMELVIREDGGIEDFGHTYDCDPDCETIFIYAD